MSSEGITEAGLQIVAELEAERALVEANRELVERMEKKIKGVVARVWGAAETPAIDRVAAE